MPSSDGVWETVRDAIPGIITLAYIVVSRWASAKWPKRDASEDELPPTIGGH